MLNKGIQLGGISVSLISGTTGREYNSQELPLPTPNTKVIGVTDQETFQIAATHKFGQKFAIAIYVDGVPVNQDKKLTLMSEIEDLHSAEDHNYFIATNSGVHKIDRYSQVSGENGLLTFTVDPNQSVNVNLTGENAALNRIDIFVWVDTHVPRELTRSAQRTRGAGLMGINGHRSRSVTFGGGTKGGPTLDEVGLETSFAGVGESTNKEYTVGKGLVEPKFMGHALFIHTPISNPNYQFVIPDPMRSVPKTSSNNV